MSSSGGACPRPSSAAACRKQTPLIAGTLFQGTKLALTAWFLALYLGGIAYRFNRRFELDRLPQRLLVAALAIGPSTEVWLRQIGTPC